VGSVYIRQHNDIAGRRFGGSASGLVKGELVTPPTELVTTRGTAVDAPAMTAKTHFVALEPIDCNVRYAVRPKAARYTPRDATLKDTPIPAGAVVYEAVYPGAIISFLEVGMPSGSQASGSGVFLPGYVPVLAL
jgi:hypothetical protein